MRSRRAIPGQIVVALFLGATACGSPARTGGPAASAPAPAREAPAAAGAPAVAPTAAPTPLQVRMAAVPGSLSHSGRYVALARGYFREEGIDFEEAAFDTSAK